MADRALGIGAAVAIFAVAVIVIAVFWSKGAQDAVKFIFVIAALAGVPSIIFGRPLSNQAGLVLLVGAGGLFFATVERPEPPAVSEATKPAIQERRTSTNESGCGHRIEAMSAAESFAKDRLKAPATARFPSNSDFRTEMLSCGTWRVTSYVDAQNSFGAPIRTYYVTVMNYSGGRWFVVSFDFM